MEPTPDIAVNDVNSFFIIVGKKNIGASSRKIPYQPLSMKKVNNCNSTVWLDTDGEEITQMINGLRADCPTGIDGISPGV